MVATIIVFGIMILSLVLILEHRDRGRDRSGKAPHRNDWEMGTSAGVGQYYHDSGGPIV